MAKAQAAALRLNWNQRASLPEGEHLSLLLEWNALGHSMGNYKINGIVFGESVTHYSQASVSY
jgi:hypothetical protein